jgi:hypothetical protein
MAAEQAQSRNGSNTKWIVVGVLGIVILLLFRNQIGDLIGRADKVEFQTPLGTLIVNDEVVEASSSQPTIAGNTYTDPANGFQISWPEGWTGDTQSGRLAIARQLGVEPSRLPIVIYKGFTPSGSNVNVVLEPLAQEISATEYLRISQGELQRQLGVTFQASSADDETGSAFLSGMYTLQGRTLLLFQRYQITGGKAIVVTATGFPPVDDLSSNTQQELLSVFNSFRLVS